MTKNSNILIVTLGAVLLSYAAFQAFGNNLKTGEDIGVQAENAKIVIAFNVWKSKQNRLYGSPTEHQFRLDVFKQNYLTVKTLKNTSNFGVELNRFADMTDEEFKIKYTGDVSESQLEAIENIPEQEDTESDQQNLGDSQYLDWREKGVVNPVQNQKSCGSCWAFTSSAVFESAYAIKYGKLLKFSESKLVDCNLHCGGCHGGNCRVSFSYLVDEGTVLASDYPYVPKQLPCDSSKIVNPIKSDNYEYRYPSSQSLLKASVDKGPTYVSIDAHPSSFKFYKEGIYDSDDCSQTTTGHAVTIIGYSIDGDDNSYWIMRNSWGPGWGDQGYMKMKMFFEGNGQCYMYRRFGRAIFN